MKNFKISKLKNLCLLLCLTLFFSPFGCANSKTDGTVQFTTDPSTDPIATSEDELENQVNLSSALTIDFDKGTIPESGVNKNGNDYSILKGGTYIVKGTLQGQLNINADKQDVWLVLDNAHITCEDSSPLCISDAKNTYLILRTGSDNSLTDGSAYSSSFSEDPDATLFCKNDLIIGGGGTLSISSNYNNALHTKDTLTIRSATININSVDTGIKAKDGLIINAGILNITCNGDGIQTTNSEDPALGNIEIHGGSITVKSEKDAIQSENALTITAGSFNLTTGGGAENADYAYSTQMMPPNQSFYSDSESDSVSMKGIKAQGAVNISGGKFNIDSEDDSLHSNGEINISAGDFCLSSGDDGIHADDVLSISEGSIEVATSYEGLEGTSINIEGGEIRINAYDDGINSAGGGDSGYGGFGPDSFSDSSDYAVNISGGYVYVLAMGDGLDSNGDITVSNGTIIVNGSESGGNAPLDWQTECKVNGGTLIACGNAQMMESLSNASEQCILSLNLGTTLSSGSLSNISAVNSQFSLTFSPAINSSYLLVSTPDLKLGETYIVRTGGAHSGKSTDGLYSDGSYTAGEKLIEVTQDSIVTSYGSSFGGMGGMHGGMGDNHMHSPGGRW
ncbi:MAG: carbohydrate-binding domain-containing protein [Ruminococcus sp.]|nr:carbohydrate-binding domain-containing protein [Ruminococcus sp.]